MMTQKHTHNDAALVRRLRRLVAVDNARCAELLACMGEVDARRLYLQAACSSMFTYCIEVLHMAEGTAYKRIHAARAGRKFPALLEMLRRGDLHLSTMVLIGPHLSDDNQAEVLPRIKHKSKREVEKVVAELAPKPDVKASVRQLPRRQEATPGGAKERSAGAQLGAPEPLSPPGEPCAAASRAPRGPTVNRTQVLAPSRYRLQVTLSEQVNEKLKRAQDLLRHQNPEGDLETLFERALDSLLTELDKRKWAKTEAPLAEQSREDLDSEKKATRPSNRHIPAAVKRTVFERDGGRCTFVADDGRRCSESGMLEFHHRLAFAKGGSSTADNIALLCRAHNQGLGREEFGEQRVTARIHDALDARGGETATPGPVADAPIDAPVRAVATAPGSCCPARRPAAVAACRPTVGASP